MEGDLDSSMYFPDSWTCCLSSSEMLLIEVYGITLST